jgi:hypothetical protein
LRISLPIRSPYLTRVKSPLSLWCTAQLSPSCRGRVDEGLDQQEQRKRLPECPSIGHGANSVTFEDSSAVTIMYTQDPRRQTVHIHANVLGRASDEPRLFAAHELLVRVNKAKSRTKNAMKENIKRPNPLNPLLVAIMECPKATNLAVDLGL